MQKRKTMREMIKILKSGEENILSRSEQEYVESYLAQKQKVKDLRKKIKLEKREAKVKAYEERQQKKFEEFKSLIKKASDLESHHDQ